MRESNFAFPAQNRACVCITSQLYDRRALDTNSPLPLLNSLSHLTYLTSTSPRIREILTCDGGLERLVRMLRDFCFSPPPPENQSAIFGLSPPGLPRPAQVPVLNPKSFDRYAAYRFSLAFQCVVNIGVRGSEPIRSRVVQAGTLDVVGCILEAWLASKGFAVGPSTSASGMPRESREQRQQRRQAQLEQRQREQAQELVRLLALERSLTRAAEEEPSVATSDAETSVSTDTSANATPSGSGTPTSTVVVPGRERSGTVVARRVWDIQASGRDQATAGPSMGRTRTIRANADAESTAPSTSTSRPETETEDDGEPDADGDVEMGTARSRDRDMDESMPPPQLPHGRRTVGIVTDAPSPATTVAVGAGSDALDVDMDAHIIINTNAADDGVADGIVALEQNVNDDLAMGAPPGAPGAIDATPRTRTNTLTLNTRNMNLGRDHPHHHVTGREELTPRAVLASLPIRDPAPRPPVPPPVAMPVAADGAGPSRAPVVGQQATLRAIQFANAHLGNGNAPQGAAIAHLPRPHRHHHHHHHAEEQGPYREEDVLLGLQLLAYLSKYPHVRQAFYKPRLSFHPATAMAMGQNAQVANAGENSGWRKTGVSASSSATPVPGAVGEKKDIGFFKTLTGRGKEKEKEKPTASTTPTPMPQIANPPRMTNVFSVVERFTFRPSPTESNLPNPPPFLPHDIQYWAGVIMRNACRKDESRGGIRQCANMLCGKWESFPREFAKCRRCRKAKYCGKECQSRAWSEGHRFWCSAREEDGEQSATATAGAVAPAAGASPFMAEAMQNAEDGAENDNTITPANIAGAASVAGVGAGGARTTFERFERRQVRDRDRARLSNAAAAALAAMQPSPSAGSALAVARNASTSSTETARQGQSLRHPRVPSGANSLHSLSSLEAPLGTLDYSLNALAQENLRRQLAAGSTSGAGPAGPNNFVPPPNGGASGTNGELSFPMGMGINLNGYSPEQQVTIRNFLQAVGITEIEAGGHDGLMPPPPRSGSQALVGPSSGGSTVLAPVNVPVQGDVDVEIDYHARRDRDRGRGTLPLPERIQAMNVVGDRGRDRQRSYGGGLGSSSASVSASRMPEEDGSTADMEVSEDETMVTGRLQ